MVSSKQPSKLVRVGTQSVCSVQNLRPMHNLAQERQLATERRTAARLAAVRPPTLELGDGLLAMLSTVLAAGAGAEPRAMRALSAKTDAKPKAVVHVGPHKMGSTSLQELIFLPENINILNQDKYEVPAHIGSTSYPPKSGADIAECYQGSPCSDPSCPSYLRNSTRHSTGSRAKLPRAEGTSCFLRSISTLPMTLLGWPRHWTPSTQQLPCHIARFSIGCHQARSYIYHFSQT